MIIVNLKYSPLLGFCSCFFIAMISSVYFSNWSVYQRKHFAIDIPAHQITHLFYAFIGIDTTTGRVRLTDEWCDVQMPTESLKSGKLTGNLQQLFQIKQQNRHVKTMMSIGGWGTDGLFQAIVSDGNKLANFVDSVADFVLEYGFDGVDIDWEYPRNSHENSKLIELLLHIRTKLDKVDKRLLLSMALPAGNEQLDVLDLNTINRYVSFFNVMCYDFAGQGWASHTAYHSNLFGDNGENSLNGADVLKRYTAAGVPNKKLIMGMPLYGRQFHGVKTPQVGEPFTKKDGEVNEIIDYKKLPIGKEYVDLQRVSAYSYDGDRFITYDNEQTTRIKAQYLKLNGFGGGMWWDSAGDNKDHSLVGAFVYQVGELDRSENVLDIYGSSTYLKELLG